MSNDLRSFATAFMALCMAGAPLASHAEEGGAWEWTIAPYLWAPSIATDLRTGQPPAETDSAFSDIIDKIDDAFLIHAEGRGDHFGAFADYIFLGLADDRQFPRIATRSDLDSQLFELAAFWSPGQERSHGLDLFGGLRYVDVDLKVRFDPVNPVFSPSERSIDKSYSDFMLGARYTWALSDRWQLTLRGDGSFGETEGTHSASAVVRYHVKHGAWIAGYRYLAIEVETGGNNTDIKLSGPLAGFEFAF
ncbi:hypothetical protein [Lysobacter soli]|uniref:hypothetical protein n=1 Tax=Lysobacter soli TaxID=453783 RepID=UPI00240EC30B|nr:hypothetical protein [Lysobacter soli]MDG2517363.1 hypothetical protein [Lysobacter soli]